MTATIEFEKGLSYCGFDYVPEGLGVKYKHYVPDERTYLIPRDFLSGLYDRYQVPEHVQGLINQGIEAIENDSVLFHFTKFLVSVMCTARNRCDDDFYTNMTPECMKELKERYSFLLLLACILPSSRMLEERGVPRLYYEEIQQQFLKPQIKKLIERSDFIIRDFPWEMNFYTGSIFLLDRFYFIPHRFQDEFTMYRHRNTSEVVALMHPGVMFRSDGQRDGINGVSDPAHGFQSEWTEDDVSITANRINPMGFLERDLISLEKKEWDPVLRKGDLVLALHIPSGAGYTPMRIKTSMTLAIAFYERYFPELAIRGFWSESWLYDSRLSLILDSESSNIVQVQRQFYTYPIEGGDGMLRYELFGARDADPSSSVLKTSLQIAAAAYMKTGARFNTLSMIVLKEEIDAIGDCPYLTAADIGLFRETVDSHLAGRSQA